MYQQIKFIFFTIFYIICISGTNGKPPNIVFILTDDQDTLLGGLKPMEQTRKLIGDSGVTFSNAFATTPICCPSRSSILTGSYLHNHKTINNSLSGGCSSVSWQKHSEHKTFATYLQNAGYTTMFAGKYLNMYGHKGSKGVQHIPPGWDWWIGLVGNSRYYNYTLSVNGTSVHHKDNYESDYLTDVIKRYSIEFLKQKVAHDSPFMMMLSTPASHAPFTPAPQYRGRYNTTQAPRFPNFNIPNRGKHWLLRMPPETLSKATVEILDDIYQSRLETLLSVDDLVADVIYNLDSIGVLANTYIFFTSDHGFHIGQFGLPWDKRQPYEFDLRIPLLVKGPMLPKNKTVTVPVLSIDFAPTFLNIAGLSIPNTMDGKSFLPSLINKHLSDIKRKKAKSRTFLVEYHGEGDMKSISPTCPFRGETFLAECTSEAECKCQDAVNNTYHCMRHLSSNCNFIYCKFLDSENFIEVYDLHLDPFQLTNIASLIKNDTKKKCEKTIEKLMQCQGVSCQTYDGHDMICV